MTDTTIATPSPIQPFITLSVGHVAQATETWLNNAARDQTNWVAVTPYGWFVYCDEESDPDYGFPSDLIAAFTYARAQGVEYIMFDSEADPIWALPFYITGNGEWQNVPV